MAFDPASSMTWPAPGRSVPESVMALRRDLEQNFKACCSRSSRSSTSSRARNSIAGDGAEAHPREAGALEARLAELEKQA